MGQVVLHFEKHGKPTGGSLGHHIDRTEGMEWSYRHADLSRTHLNKVYQFNEYSKMPYNEAIKKRIEDGYTGKKGIRKDATYSVNVMLSGSHEEMKEIERDPKKLNEWIKQNANWCIRQFGKENIIRFNVHLDEKTPHIHCAFVPITKDGRLSAKDFIGSSIKLQDLQSSYANAMKSFGLERGIKSDRKHQTTDEYRRREAQNIQKIEHLHEKIDNLSKKNLIFGLDDFKKDLKAGLNSYVEVVNQEFNRKERKIAEEYVNLREGAKEFMNSIENREPIVSKYIPPADVQNIVNNSNLIDYFLYLANRGDLVFEKKSGKEFIFEDENKTQKISVSEKGWHDLKSGEGGQIIKAIQKHQKLDWLEAVNWLKNFNGDISIPFQKLRKKTAKESVLKPNTYAITQITTPGSRKLIEYFKNRSISFETLKNHSKQVHYQVGENHFYGIGVKNVQGGYEIRNPFSKMKFGSSDVSELGKEKPGAKKIVVCEGITDSFSIIEILKRAGKNLDDYRFISLNSVTNAQKFIDKYLNQTYDGVFLLLDGDTAGDEATKKIQEAFPQGKVRDLRDDFGIHSQGYKDINEHLVKESQKQEKKQTLKAPEPTKKGHGFKR
ncbi:hypothetical protein CAPN002_25750 [Capnocytophaga stomatis]|uniref:MobV family relaxase n=1 Tax=Capnocytophaga stomatis TaxID=1848904 RepID=UPI0019515361|nr:MobV family relaxase [Capnocytophaga stomatis]GIJ95357.1 hypothetical protein CAPN002_25750 [Capnocytophaga stomatis]